MSYNLLSDCFICDLQLLVVLTASERHRINNYPLTKIDGHSTAGGERK